MWLFPSQVFLIALFSYFRHINDASHLLWTSAGQNSTTMCIPWIFTLRMFVKRRPSGSESCLCLTISCQYFSVCLFFSLFKETVARLVDSRSGNKQKNALINCPLPYELKLLTSYWDFNGVTVLSAHVIQSFHLLVISKKKDYSTQHRDGTASTLLFW